MNKRLIGIASVVAGLVIAGVLAGFMSLSKAQADPTLDGTWNLTAIAAPGGEDMVAGLNAPVTATIGDDMITGFSGCNQYTAPFATHGSSVTIGEVAMTMMFCDGVNIETPYVALLPSVDSWSVQGDLLALSSGGSVVLSFQRV